MITTYRHSDGAVTVAQNQVWVHGIFADERTARYACRFSDAELHRLDHVWEHDKENRAATFEELQQLRRDLKAVR